MQCMRTSSVSVLRRSARLCTPSSAAEQPKAQQIAVSSVLLPDPVVQALRMPGQWPTDSRQLLWLAEDAPLGPQMPTRLPLDRSSSSSQAAIERRPFTLRAAILQPCMLCNVACTDPKVHLDLDDMKG